VSSGSASHGVSVIAVQWIQIIEQGDWGVVLKYPRCMRKALSKYQYTAKIWPNSPLSIPKEGAPDLAAVFAAFDPLISLSIIRYPKRASVGDLDITLSFHWVNQAEVGEG
jgi:hypothetical protein